MKTMEINLCCQRNLMILGLLGSAVLYILRINLSVAIVAMVDHSKKSEEVHFEESCPQNILPSEEGKKPEFNAKGEFGWNEEMQGRVLASFFYGYILTNLLGGGLADRYGGKIVFGGSIFCTSILAFLLPSAARHSKEMFSCIRLLQGMSGGVQFPAINTLMSNWVQPAKRGYFMTRISGGAVLGTVLTMFFGGWLAQSSFGWPSVFYVSGSVGLLFCVAWYHLVGDHPSSHPQILEDEKNLLLQEIDRSKTNADQRLSTPWKSIFTSVPFLAAVATHTGINFGWYCLLMELPTYLATVHHFDLKSNGFISSMPYMIMLCFSLCYGSLMHRLTASNAMSLKVSRKLSTAIGAFVPMVLMLTISSAGCNHVLVVMIICVSVASSAAIQCGNLCSFQDLAPNYAGTLTGIGNTFATAPGFLAPLITGVIINDQPTIGQWNKVFMITSFIYFLAACIYLKFMSADVQPWNDPTRLKSTVKRVRNV